MLLAHMRLRLSYLVYGHICEQAGTTQAVAAEATSEVDKERTTLEVEEVPRSEIIRLPVVRTVPKTATLFQVRCACVVFSVGKNVVKTGL
jgi:hypothetical protein